MIVAILLDLNIVLAPTAYSKLTNTGKHSNAINTVLAPPGPYQPLSKILKILLIVMILLLSSGV